MQNIQTVTDLKIKILDFLCLEPEIDRAMDEVLATVGTYFNVDRVYIFENAPGDLACINTFEWCNEGIIPQKDNLQYVEYKDGIGDTWKSFFSENDVYLCKNINDLPDRLRDFLGMQQIKSMLQCAINVHGKFKGCIGFDNCSEREMGWEKDKDAVDTLVYISHLMTLYIQDYRQKKNQIEASKQKMQLKINQANNMFESLLANVDCGVAIYRAYKDGEITLEYVNEGLCELTECNKDELMLKMGSESYLMANDKYKDDINAAFYKVVNNKEKVTVKYEAESLKGKHIWIMAKLSGSFAENESVLVYSTFFDISSEMETSNEIERKYEVEKRRSQDDSSVLAYAVFNLSTGNIIEMERRSPLLPVKKMMTLSKFKEDIEESIISEEQRKRYDKMFDAQNLIKDFKEGIDEHNIEFQRILPSGKVIWVKSCFHLIPEPGGSDILMFYYCNDINLRKSLEIMTEYMANEDYDMIGCINFQDDSSIMMYGKNSCKSIKADGGHAHCEENYTDSLEWFVENAIVKEERKEYRSLAFIEKIKKELYQNGNYEFDVHVYGKNGEYLTKRIRYTSYDKESDICFFTQIDITKMLADEEKKQKQLSSALMDAKRANESKTMFFSRMSHDMRTPMNGILGLAQLSEDENDIEVLKSNMEKIKVSGQYLLGLINDTLDFQRIESGKLKLEPEVVNSKDIFSNMVEMLKGSLVNKNINFNIINKNVVMDCFLLVDPVRIKQIFLNILSNAIKFTPEGGNIDVEFECYEREGMTSHDRFVIRDTGIGMTKDFIENSLFKPFSQEHNEVTGLYAGSGLGLSIVKSLIELMGGKISVKSQVGVGTEFTIYLDFERVDTQEAQNMRNSRNEIINNVNEELRGKRILLTEDHPLNAEIATKLLEKEGCIVEWAKNGQECVNMFLTSEKNYYNIILMDVRMPVMDGMEAAAYIRNLGREDAKSIPIIAMTANAYKEDVDNCIASGMNGHISKPVEPGKLFEIIAESTK